jgi:hypothetical protein
VQHGHAHIPEALHGGRTAGDAVDHRCQRPVVPQPWPGLLPNLIAFGRFGRLTPSAPGGSR